MKRKNSRSVAQMRTKSSARKSTRKPAAAAKSSGVKSSRDKVRAHRERMRAKGLRLVQLWLPDIRTAEFAAEARRQSRLANIAPSASADQVWADAMIDWKID